MTEPTITCPNCKTEIKLTESLAAPLIAATRKQFEQQLAQKDSDIAQREQAMRDKEKRLAEDKRKLDDQVPDTPHLFDRIRDVLESARTSVTRTVNSTQVLAHLSEALTAVYGRDWSVQSLSYMKQFYLSYLRLLAEGGIFHATSGELSEAAILHAVRGEPAAVPANPT